MCHHSPTCPSADAADHDAAKVVSSHPEQGWSLLCNGVVLFEDTGELMPDRQIVAPHRPTCRRWTPIYSAA
jgi:hypothetical protein